MTPSNVAIDEVLASRHEAILAGWLQEVQATAAGRGSGADPKVRADAAELLEAFHEAIRADGDSAQFEQPVWQRTRTSLEALSRARAAQGATAGQTSHFVMALKHPLFAGLQQGLAAQPERLVEALWAASTLVDKMAQWTADTYQRSREDIIRRQQDELLELSTPVVKLWDGVLAVPMIGTLDSARTQVVMETLLQRIVDTGSGIAIIDITGVPTVDTLVAQHLLKTVAATRLMGADCIISGIRPQIAQTIVHLGIDLQASSPRRRWPTPSRTRCSKVGYTFSRAAA